MKIYKIYLGIRHSDTCTIVHIQVQTKFANIFAINPYYLIEIIYLQMWALMLNAIKGAGNFPTYYFQPLLPKLPVPDLNTSCDR